MTMGLIRDEAVQMGDVEHRLGRATAAQAAITPRVEPLVLQQDFAV